MAGRFRKGRFLWEPPAIPFTIFPKRSFFLRKNPGLFRGEERKPLAQAPLAVRQVEAQGGLGACEFQNPPDRPTNQVVGKGTVVLRLPPDHSSPPREKGKPPRQPAYSLPVRAVALFWLLLGGAWALAQSQDAAKQASLERWLWEASSRLVGIPYLWGGDGNGGFDCSGLTRYVYRHLGVNLPRTSREQFAALPPVPPGEQVRPGDLLFFSQSGKAIDHVAIYIGRGYILHASGRHGKVVVEPWTALREIYVGARRPFRWGNG